MNSAVHHFDAAKMRTLKIAQELIVVAGNINDCRALAAFAQKFLHNIVVFLWPMPVASQTPAINDITNQIDRFSIMATQEVQQKFGLSRFGAKMHVRNKQSAVFL